MPPWCWPAIETLSLVAGASGSFILAAVAPKIDVKVYKTEPGLDWVQSSPVAATAKATPSHPCWFRAGFILLGLSFLAQIALVWLRWCEIIR
jgi:hypothetical protein